MNMNAHAILIILAVICWFLAAINVNLPRLSAGWLGVFFFGVSLLV